MIRVSYGFRPFFLCGALWSAFAIALLIPVLEGHLSIPSALSPIIWHQHEMIFGYVPAIVAGFLLTAVPNWTGRLPVVGSRLAALFAIWVAGRIAVFFSAVIGAGPAAVIDIAFLATLGAVVARDIIAAGNWRNLKVLVILVVLLAANIASHVEAASGAANGFGSRAGIAATILLIGLIGGRIIPSFTRNWLVKHNPGSLPAPFGRLDAAVLIVTLVALAAWVFGPARATTSALAFVAMIANVWRLLRWQGHRTFREPLVLVLHVAFAFVPVGFGLIALSGLTPALLLPSGAIHGWTAGAIGLMTLAVMTRASLGHTGQPLVATTPISLLYLAILLAALSRIAVSFAVLPEILLTLSASSWMIGFLGFAVVYAPLLLRRQS